MKVRLARYGGYERGGAALRRTVLSTLALCSLPGCGELLGVDFDNARPPQASSGGSSQGGTSQGGSAAGGGVGGSGAFEPCEPGAICNEPATVALGKEHSCAITETGVRCWGTNEAFEISPNSLPNGRSAVPLAIAGLGAGVRTSSASHSRTCAVDAAARPHCWGEGGAWASALDGVADKVSEIGVGAFHACLVVGGQVRCWGANDKGQLGDGSYDDRSAPTPVEDLSDVRGLALGREHSCAMRGDGQVWCWGSNQAGQLGSHVGDSSATPVVMDVLPPAQRISSGAQHSCIITNAGDHRCWGYDFWGQLGNAHQGLPELVQISAGTEHTCATSIDGQGLCWGSAWGGRLGAPGANTGDLVSVEMTSMPEGIDEISAGGTHSCARTTSGRVLCWGDNREAQLGLDPAAQGESEVPVEVSGL